MASSSAWMSVPCSIPLSRSISWTASMISWVMALPSLDQIAPDDQLVGDFVCGGTGGEADRAVAGVDELAAEALAAVDLLRGANRDLVADRADEVRRLAKRRLGPG